MKDLLKKVFSQKTASPIFVGFGAFAIITFIVFPGLTAANTVLNILSGIVGLFTLIFIYYYINPEELQPKKKKTVKKDSPIVKVQKKK